MSSCIKVNLRSLLKATLALFSFLIISAIISGNSLSGDLLSDRFLHVGGISTAFAASDTPAHTDNRLLLNRIDYPSIDDGETAVTVPVNDGYPGPPLRGYPAPKPFQRLNLDPNIKASLKANIKDVFIQLEFPDGTTSRKAEIQLYQLEGILDIIQDRVFGSAISLQAIDEEGNLIVRFNVGVTVIFTFEVTGASGAAMADDTIKLYQWDANVGAWVPVASTLNMEDGTVTATITRPGEFALMRNGRIFMPAIYE